MTVNAVVRDALMTTIESYAVAGGALEGVVVLREAPYNYADLYGQAQGMLDLIWLSPGSGPVEIGALGATVRYEETMSHTLHVQVDRQPDSWTQELVDERADAIVTVIQGILSDPSKAGCGPTLGINLAANGLDYLDVRLVMKDYATRQLQSGGTAPGHSAGYVLDIQHEGAAKIAAPALP